VVNITTLFRDIFLTSKRHSCWWWRRNFLVKVNPLYKRNDKFWVCVDYFLVLLGREVSFVDVW